jgi:tRNA(fMet)-specific endonuclease VapC
MTLLDTDHVSILELPEADKYARLRARMEAVGNAAFSIPVITVEEQMRGWLGRIRRAKSVRDEVKYYVRLAEMIGFFGAWLIAPFDDRAVDRFKDLRGQKVRIGTMDLKIAAIALANDALLLTANRRDFSKVPGLRVENWLV